MSLESEIKKLNEVLTKIHSAIAAANSPGEQIINAGLNVEPAGLTNDRPPPKADFEPTARLPTVEETNRALQETAAAMGDGGLAVITLMQNQFGSKRLSEISPTRYGELLEKVKGLTNAR